MELLNTLNQRANSQCELCAASDGLTAFAVGPKPGDSADEFVLACTSCVAQLADPARIDANHWRCLNDSMWSDISAVQVLVWRVLNHLAATEDWPQALLDMLYLDDETQGWASA